MSFYLESKPKNLSYSIFKLYQYVSTDLRDSPGIIVEDCCPEFMFVKQKDVLLKVAGTVSKKVPNAFTLGAIRNPYKFNAPEK